MGRLAEKYMKAVITKLFITEAQIPYIPYIAHIFQKSMYKHHSMKCDACEHIATLPRGTQRIVNIIIECITLPRSHLRLHIHCPSSLQPWDISFQKPESGLCGGGSGGSDESKERYNDVYNALRASRQCCNVLACRTLHAVVFIHRFLKYMGDI